MSLRQSVWSPASALPIALRSAHKVPVGIDTSTFIPRQYTGGWPFFCVRSTAITTLWVLRSQKEPSSCIERSRTASNCRLYLIISSTIARSAAGSWVRWMGGRISSFLNEWNSTSSSQSTCESQYVFIRQMCR